MKAIRESTRELRLFQSINLHLSGIRVMWEKIVTLEGWCFDKTDRLCQVRLSLDPSFDFEIYLLLNSLFLLYWDLIVDVLRILVLILLLSSTLIDLTDSFCSNSTESCYLCRDFMFHSGWLRVYKLVQDKKDEWEGCVQCMS